MSNLTMDTAQEALQKSHVALVLDKMLLTAQVSDLQSRVKKIEKDYLLFKDKYEDIKKSKQGEQNSEVSFRYYVQKIMSELGELTTLQQQNKDLGAEVKRLNKTESSLKDEIESLRAENRQHREDIELITKWQNDQCEIMDAFKRENDPAAMYEKSCINMLKHKLNQKHMDCERHHVDTKVIEQRDSEIARLTREKRILIHQLGNARENEGVLEMENRRLKAELQITIKERKTGVWVPTVSRNRLQAAERRDGVTEEEPDCSDMVRIQEFTQELIKSHSYHLKTMDLMAEIAELKALNLDLDLKQAHCTFNHINKSELKYTEAESAQLMAQRNSLFEKLQELQESRITSEFERTLCNQNQLIEELQNKIGGLQRENSFLFKDNENLYEQLNLRRKDDLLMKEHYVKTLQAGQVEKSWQISFLEKKVESLNKTIELLREDNESLEKFRNCDILLNKVKSENEHLMTQNSIIMSERDDLVRKLQERETALLEEKTEMERLQRENDCLKLDIDKVKSENCNFRDKEKLMQTFEAERLNIISERDNLSRRLQEVEIALEEVRSEKELFRMSLLECTRGTEKIEIEKQSAIDYLENQNKRFKLEIAELKSEIEAIMKDREKHFATVNEQNEKIENLEEEKFDLNVEIQILKQTLRDLEETVQNLKALQEQNLNLHLYIEKLKRDHEETISEVSKIEERHENEKSEIIRQKNSDIDSLVNDRNNCSCALEKANDALRQEKMRTCVLQKEIENMRRRRTGRITSWFQRITGRAE